MFSRDNRKSDSDRRSCFRSVIHYPKKLLELGIRRVEEQVWRNPFDFQKKKQSKSTSFFSFFSEILPNRHSWNEDSSSIVPESLFFLFLVDSNESTRNEV